MPDVKACGKSRGARLNLGDCFETLEEQLKRAIDALDDINELKAARKELKSARLAIVAIERQVTLYRKELRV